MVDSVEIAQEHIHEAHHADSEADPWPRKMAVVVSILAASLAIAEIGAKSAQTAYLTHNITVSDTWSFYQAKNLRATVRHSQADLLESLPNAADPAIQKKIRDARSEEARMRDDPKGGDGMEQLRHRALHEEEEREHAFHTYHGYELAAGALEIAIVLSSASVVTKIKALGIAAGLVGTLSIAFGLAVWGHVY